MAAMVAETCARLGARAAGYWRIDRQADRLLQVAFAAGEGLDPEVARRFAAGTVSVPLDQSGLGIVAAAVTGRPAISLVESLPEESGSGKWLRSFDASRSVAVPIRGPDGGVLGVFSVALSWANPLDDQAVIERILDSAGS
jgi:hypothetical protein